ncbi:MAG: hypothetical protein KKD09_19740, partial [Gammaproteobacteria bacterium]|nr:hypothetical protein [Gammaproteobacteria bacterium]
RKRPRTGGVDQLPANLILEAQITSGIQEEQRRRHVLTFAWRLCFCPATGRRAANSGRGPDVTAPRLALAWRQGRRGRSGVRVGRLAAGDKLRDLLGIWHTDALRLHLRALTLVHDQAGQPAALTIVEELRTLRRSLGFT